MCTLIALHRCVDGVDLLVAANRDEYFDRPSEGPALRSTPSGPVIAPLDVRAGGTWFGLNTSGVFAALTNRPCTDPDPRMRSRGLVPVQALAAASASQAAEILERIPPGVHNPFNAFLADGRQAFAGIYGERMEIVELEPGAHVVGNADPDDRSDPKLARVLAQADHAASLPFDDAVSELARVCRQHDCEGPRGALDDTCVHLGSYGTRSSFVLSLGQGGAARRLLYAEGPPCETDYDDITALLSELSSGASYGDGEPHARTLR